MRLPAMRVISTKKFHKEALVLSTLKHSENCSDSNDHIAAAPAFWFIFKQDDMLLQTIDHQLCLPKFTNLFFISSAQTPLYLGTYEETPCYALEIHEKIHREINWPLKNIAFHALKLTSIFQNELLWCMASRAKQRLFWDKMSQFCGYCGNPMIHHKKEPAKWCNHCNKMLFPRISPAVLVLVHKNNQILMARSHHFPDGIYSILAGFVEQGETLEQTAHREVYEEVGITIKNLQYFGSQPWPFPDNLMIGFFAEYEAGEIDRDPIEIEDAAWFSVDNLPSFPNPLSLSRRMIDAFVANQ